MLRLVFLHTNNKFSFLKTFEHLIRPVVTVAIDTLFAVGFPLPSVENITFSGWPTAPRLTTCGPADNANELRVDADLSYAGFSDNFADL